MKIKDAIDWIDIARMGYICDPNECGLEKGGAPCSTFHCDETHNALATAIEALQIADRLEQAEGELKYEYALINDWFMNKYDLNVEHTELETDALHFTGIIMQTISYLLGSLADVRGDAEWKIKLQQAE